MISACLIESIPSSPSMSASISMNSWGYPVNSATIFNTLTRVSSISEGIFKPTDFGLAAGATSGVLTLVCWTDGLMFSSGVGEAIGSEMGSGEYFSPATPPTRFSSASTYATSFLLMTLRSTLVPPLASRVQLDILSMSNLSVSETASLRISVSAI